MEPLRQRLELASRALAALLEALGMPESSIVRDATIQRFELTFEILWKAGRDFLRVQEGIDASSPKSVIRASHPLGLLTEAEALDALNMADDRNLTSHTYDETVAKAIASRIPGHARVMEAWLTRMRDRAGKP